MRLSAETSDLGGTPGRRSALFLFLKEGVESSAPTRVAKASHLRTQSEGPGGQSIRGSDIWSFGFGVEWPLLPWRGTGEPKPQTKPD